MTEFLGHIFIIIVVGYMAFCATRALILYIRQFPREPNLDELDYDNGHPDGFVAHFAVEKREVRR
ncbi:hypothetical protein NL154_05565 [Rhizobium sp. YTUHZ044]|uniref:hypothetical protein n=1 Tax=Rhizobium sp. YTUHZ044 TaxID=2962678 RepID=UPI003DA9D491